MAAYALHPETLEEKIVYYAIVGTWAIWLIGGLYIVGPLIGYGLLALGICRYLGLLKPEKPMPRYVPVAVWLWVAGICVMTVSLVAAHSEWQLGTVQTVKSLIGWAKGWALFAVFPLATSLLSIRPRVIYRASSILAIQTLILIPFFYAVAVAGLPKDLYVSPLSKIGGPGPEFFDVTLYAIDDTDGALRWRFFAPWATAAAFAASVGLLFSIFERRLWMRAIGVVSAVLVCWMAGSRSSIVAIPVVLTAIFFISNAHRPWMYVLLAALAVAFFLSLDQLIVIGDQLKTDFEQARAASSRVRATLNNIGYHRWLDDAFWFGHGTVERGPHLVHYMPIGSHHTWYGLLFVKGIVGFIALAIPIGWSIVELSFKAQADRVAQCALAIVLSIVIFSFADNLEVVAYLVWPALIIMAVGLNRPFRNPYRAPLGEPRMAFPELPWNRDPVTFFRQP